MVTQGVPLQATDFFSIPAVSVTAFSSHPVSFKAVRAARTPHTRTRISSSLNLSPIPRGDRGDSWKLDSLMMVELSRDRAKWRAATTLEGVPLSVRSDTEVEAVELLIDTLGRLREDLEGRAESLRGRTKAKLPFLRRLVVRALPWALAREFEEFRRLERNWDSYGAPPLDPASLWVAEDILIRALVHGLPVPSVAPGSDGGVGIEWQVGPDTELEVDVTPGEATAYVLVTPEGAREGVVETDADLDRLLTLL